MLGKKQTDPGLYWERPKAEWVVMFDPSVSEETPYYVELQYGGHPGPGFPQFFKTESEAIAAMHEKIAQSRRREALRQQTRVVARAPAE